MNDSTQLIYPALNLLLYSGRDRCPAREDLGDKQPKRLKPPQNGYLYQRILGDAYALQINCMDSEDAEWTYHPKSIDCYLDIKQRLLTESHLLESQAPDAQPGVFGRSWLLVGRLGDEDQNPDYVAKDCYHSLALTDQPSWPEDLIGQGRILDATFFELWRAADCDRPNPFHLYICIFDCRASLKRLDKLYHHLLTLGLYRHRATWSYQRTRTLKTDLVRYYQDIRSINQQMNFHVQKTHLHLDPLAKLLRHSLVLLSQYAEALNEFETHTHALESYLESYQDRCRLIGKLDGQADTQYLERFKNFAIRRYLRPMKRDYHQLSPGLRLLEDSLRVMTGMLQLEQSYRQHHIERVVVTVTTGIGVMPLVSSVLAPRFLVSQPAGNFGGWAIAFAVLLVLSLSTGAILAALIWRLFPLLMRSPEVRSR
jgi:hypothetical protein